jgi:hypothetical protein
LFTCINVLSVQSGSSPQTFPRAQIYLDQITHLTNSSVFIRSPIHHSNSRNISPGLTYGIISCEWELTDSSLKIPPSGFAVTYIQNIELEQLQAEYDKLNAMRQSLVQNFTELESNFEGEEGSTRNLMYVFVLTTVVAIITVVVLLITKPQSLVLEIQYFLYFFYFLGLQLPWIIVERTARSFIIVWSVASWTTRS